MGFFDWLFGTKKINELNNQIVQFQKQLSDAKAENDATEKILEGTLITLKKVEDELKLLKEPNYADKPTWLDDTQEAYQPLVQVVDDKGGIGNVAIEPQDIYAISPTLEKLVDNLGWRNLSVEQRLWQIWSFVTDRCDYQYDFGEAWNYPTTTYYRRRGDCDDTTILFVTLCRISGIKPDRIYNACGWYHTPSGNVGHSYPIAQKDDGKWYIYETTLPSINASYQPKLFKGSNYTADFGCANWLYQGGIQNGQGQI